MEIRLFQSFNHQEFILKVQLLISSSYYIVPNPSTTLIERKQDYYLGSLKSPFLLFQTTGPKTTGKCEIKAATRTPSGPAPSPPRYFRHPWKQQFKPGWTFGFGGHQSGIQYTKATWIPTLCRVRRQCRLSALWSSNLRRL